MAVARFIDHRAFTVREGQAAALQAWLEKNEQQLAAAYPAGSQYLGTFAEIYGGEAPGWWHLFMGLDSYAGGDAVSAAAGDRDSEFGRLVSELLSFFDLSNSARSGAWLYRAAPSVVVWENK
ncbi:MAG: hypothetical protein WEB29_04530 [Chloroflexota bacterium]